MKNTQFSARFEEMEPEQDIAHILAEGIEDELLRLRQEQRERCRANTPACDGSADRQGQLRRHVSCPAGCRDGRGDSASHGCRRHAKSPAELGQGRFVNGRATSPIEHMRCICARLC